MLDEIKPYEKDLLNFDLNKLNYEDKLAYYKHYCKELNLNEGLKPLAYMELKGKMTLYLTKSGADQLRALHKISIKITDKHFDKETGVYIVEVTGINENGRQDTACGVVNVKGLYGDNLANAIMKAETKAKRRLTLSMCSVPFVDETELETIQGCKIIDLKETKIENNQINISEIFDGIKNKIQSSKSIEELENYLSSIRNEPIAKDKNFNLKIKSLADAKKDELIVIINTGETK